MEHARFIFEHIEHGAVRDALSQLLAAFDALDAAVHRAQNEQDLARAVGPQHQSHDTAEMKDYVQRGRPNHERR